MIRVLCAVLLAGWAAQAAEPAVPRPNIVMIVIDTLRADHVGCYGYARSTTPRLDRLAAQGARCDHMVAASSWTIPGVMSLFTGLPPSLHGVVDYNHKLRTGVTTLAAELKRVGYRTVGITANPLAHTKYGFGVGFDIYDDFTIPLGAGIIADKDRHEHPTLPASSPAISQFGVSWLERKRKAGTPFFLYLHYMDVHADYTPPVPYDRRFRDPEYQGDESGRDVHLRSKVPKPAEADQRQMLALYDGEIAYTDESIGLVLDAIDRLALADDTIVVAVSDHGEQFWEHGGLLHGDTLFDELTRVPCIVRWPGRIPAGAVLAHQVAHVDVLPTLLEAAAVDVPKGVHGQSLLKALGGDASTALRPEAFSETRIETPLQISIRTHAAKVVLQVEAGTYSAFDLVRDPLEQHDIAAMQPAWLPDLVGKLDAWAAMCRVRDVDAPQDRLPALDAEAIRLLKSMGYFH